MISSKSFKVISVAILFAACGALSSLWLLSNFPDRWEFLFPLPFALLCTVFFMRKAEAVFSAALMDGVWLIASYAADVVAVPHLSSYLPGFVGGSIGGFGLVLCTVIADPSAVSLKRIAYGGLIGAIAGLAFGPWTQIHMAQLDGANINEVFPRTVPILAFAIW